MERGERRPGVLRSIVYISERVTELSEADIDLLAERSSVHNDSVGISGILFCFSERFIQVLEGPGPAVGELYKRIRLDTRHHDVTTVHDVPIEERAYPGWGMRRIHDEELGETEKALIFHALRVFEPQTLLGPKVRTVGDPARTFMRRIMARALPSELSIGESHAVSSLLYATEIILARDAVISEEILETVARDAHISSQLAHAYFPTVNDLMRTCVLRILALEHQAFLSQIASKHFKDKLVLAKFISDFIIKNYDRTAVSHRFADQFAKYGGDFTRETAWIIALAASEAAPRDGWPFPDLDTTTLAAAIGATDGATRISARHDFVSLADPATKIRLLRICLVAIDGERIDDALARQKTRTKSLSESSAMLFSDS
jgi:hypothetical protein